MKTPSRRAASRSSHSHSSATRTATRSTALSKPSESAAATHKAQSASLAQSQAQSPVPLAGHIIPIDPALLAEETAAALQEDLDAEGEVDDGVGFQLGAVSLGIDGTVESLTPTKLSLSHASVYYYPSLTDDNAVDDTDIPTPLAPNFALDPHHHNHNRSHSHSQPRASSSRTSLPPNDFETASAASSQRRKRTSRPPKAHGAYINDQVAHTVSTSPSRSKGKPKGSSSISTGANGTSKAVNGSVNGHGPTGGLGPFGILPETTCSLCGGTENKNRQNHREKMVSCVRCGRSGHPSCLGHKNPAVIKKMMSYDWCCIECKPCEVCLVQGDDHKLLFCDGCDRGWHSYCLNPPLGSPPKGSWYCPKCIEESEPPSSSKSLSTPVASSRKGKGRATELATTDPLRDTTPTSRSHKARASTSLSLDDSPAPTPSASIPRIRIKTNGVGGGPSVVKDKLKRRDSENHHRSGKATPSAATTPASAPSGIVVRLRVPSGGRRQEIEVEDQEEKSPYGGVLDGEDADTSRTTITEADKNLFEKSRKAAEARLGGPPPPLWDPQTSITASPALSPRPSTPAPLTSAKGTPGNVTPVLSKSTPVSYRPLRDRVLLQQSSVSAVPDAWAATASSFSPVTHTGTMSMQSPGATIAAAVLGKPEKIKTIRFGIYDIDTWYEAPYPEEYAQVPDGRLWLCEFCLKYMKSGFVSGRHRMKCKARHPPGDEIYRDGSVSVFEVDGRKNKIYCQNLCLLAKMFLDHKTLYYDVEPFLFYVMTEVDELGARFVGYFSKEKRSPDNNVSCIMTLPVRQRKGWGQLLIDFSYLLSKKEGRVGSPEKPLSGLGALSYKSYWKITVFQQLRHAARGVRLEDISAATSMTLEDIFTTLQDHGMIRIHDSPPRTTPQPRSKARNRGRTSRGTPRQQPHQQQPVVEEEMYEGKSTKIDLPKRYDIIINRDYFEPILRKHEAKEYLKLRPERLKYTPFLTTRDPGKPPGAIAMATLMAVGLGDSVNGDGYVNGNGYGNAIGDLDDQSATTSSGNKEIISTPAGDADADAEGELDLDLDAEGEPEPVTPGGPEGGQKQIVAGEDQATLDLVAALTSSPSRNLRKRHSVDMPATVERSSQRLRSAAAAAAANTAASDSSPGERLARRRRSLRGSQPGGGQPIAGDDDMNGALTITEEMILLGTTGTPTRKASLSLKDSTAAGVASMVMMTVPDVPVDEDEEEEWGDEDAEGEDDEEYVEM